MSMKRPYAAVCAALGFALCAAPVFASAYPTQTCVSAKLKSASKKCKADLKAWSSWDASQDAMKRDTTLGTTASKFAAEWTKAEDKSTAKGADCTDTTANST